MDSYILSAMNIPWIFRVFILLTMAPGTARYLRASSMSSFFLSARHALGVQLLGYISISGVYKWIWMDYKPLNIWIYIYVLCMDSKWFIIHLYTYIYIYMAVCQNLVPLVNIKIAGKWMFIPLKMVLIGIDPYPYIYISIYWVVYNPFSNDGIFNLLLHNPYLKKKKKRLIDPRKKWFWSPSRQFLAPKFAQIDAKEQVKNHCVMHVQSITISSFQ